MHSDFSLPFQAEIWPLLLFFFVLLIVFDLVLVRWLKLGRIAWKRVDYVWLGFSAIGLVGAASQARQFVASNLVRVYDERSMAAYSIARFVLDDDAKDNGYVCRTFVRSQYSPPPEEMGRAQRENDAACHWFKSVAALLPKDSRNLGLLSDQLLPAQPQVDRRDLKETFDEFRKTVGEYNEAVRMRSDNENAAARSDLENTLIIIFPLLLAIALALRITKVTGEIKLG
jgi:hypothetical protein